MQWIAYDCGLCTCIPNVLQLFQIYLLSWIHNIFHIQSLGEITTSCFCWSIALLSRYLPCFKVFTDKSMLCFQETRIHRTVDINYQTLPRHSKLNSTSQNKVHPQHEGILPPTTTFENIRNTASNFQIRFLYEIDCFSFKPWVIQKCLMLYIKHTF